MSRAIRGRFSNSVLLGRGKDRRLELEELLPLVKWASVRLGIQSFVVFLFVTVFGGIFTYPLVTKIFLNDWRFWRYILLGPKLYFWMWRCLGHLIKDSSYSFFLSVPLTAPPQSSPDTHLVKLRQDWEGGSSCAGCTRCCDHIGCPMVDKKNNCCLGYDSISWRYFNCGRFPISQQQLDYYQCPKWELH